MSTFETERMVSTLREAAGKAGFTPAGAMAELDGLAAADGGKLCLGMECLDRDLWDYDPAAPLIRMTGVHRVRLQSGWQKTEATPGVYDFAWLDAIVNRLLADGIRPFLSLSYGNRIYCEDPAKYPNLNNGGVGHIPVETERERAGWVNYVRAAVRHFKDRISEFEIWNEPDVSVFCVCGMPWADAYMELVKLASPVIRKEAPEAKVITCTAGLAATRMLLERGMGDYTDIHAFHNYSFYPEQYSRDYFRNQILSYRQMAPHLLFWRDEAGCPSYNDPISKGALSSCVVSECRQMKLLLRHLLCDIANDDIALTSYFHAYDFEHFSHKLRYYYGIIRHDPLSRKPSYDVFQVLAHIFDGETRTDSSVGLAVQPKRGAANADTDSVRLKLLSMLTAGRRVFAYYMPDEINDELWVKPLQLSMPFLQEIRKPVILDPVTRLVYPIRTPEQFTAPLTDYPMLIVDAADYPALFSDADGGTEHIREKIAQVYEE